MLTIMRRPLSILWFGVAMLLASDRVLAIGDFNIHINAGPTLQAHPDALAAFELAAADWESHISTPIRINIDADMQTTTSTTVIGSTTYGSENLNLDYTLVRDAMATRAARPGDGILASLPTTSEVSANVPPEGTFDNTTIGLTRANQKALGLIASPLTDTVIDGVIRFNLNFSFDYDRSDGLAAGTYDFQTVAAHELGHVLGFVSDTDDYDLNPALFDNATTMDLFRFNAGDIPQSELEFTTKPREMRPGQPAVFYDLANLFDLSTGSRLGDGNQASHWKDDFYLPQLIGIMDPTLGPQTIEEISRADLRVIELIGYDTVIPEPGSWFMIMLLLLCRTVARATRP